MHVYMFACIHVCMHACMCIYACVYMHVVCMHVVRTHENMNVSVGVVFVRTQDGVTPLDSARSEGHLSVVAYLTGTFTKVSVTDSRRLHATLAVAPVPPIQYVFSACSRAFACAQRPGLPRASHSGKLACLLG